MIPQYGINHHMSFVKILKVVKIPQNATKITYLVKLGHCHFLTVNHNLFHICLYPKRIIPCSHGHDKIKLLVTLYLAKSFENHYNGVEVRGRPTKKGLNPKYVMSGGNLMLNRTKIIFGGLPAQ